MYPLHWPLSPAGIDNFRVYALVSGLTVNKYCIQGGLCDIGVLIGWFQIFSISIGWGQMSVRESFPGEEGRVNVESMCHYLVDIYNHCMNGIALTT